MPPPSLLLLRARWLRRLHRRRSQAKRRRLLDRLPSRRLPRVTRSIGSNQKKSAGAITGMGIGTAAIGAGAIATGVGVIIGAGTTTGTAIGGAGEGFTRLPYFLL